MADPAPEIVRLLRKNAGETVRVALEVYRQTRLIDLRVVVPLASHTDTLVPTAKGIALSIGQLPELRAALTDAEARARELGWLA